MTNVQKKVRFIGRLKSERFQSREVCMWAAAAQRCSLAFLRFFALDKMFAVVFFAKTQEGSPYHCIVLQHTFCLRVDMRDLSWYYPSYWIPSPKIYRYFIAMQIAIHSLLVQTNSTPKIKTTAYVLKLTANQVCISFNQFYIRDFRTKAKINLEFAHFDLVTEEKPNTHTR